LFSTQSHGGAARHHLGVDGIDDVVITDEPLQSPEPDGDPVQLAVASGGRQVQVKIRARPRSCHAEPGTPVVLEVLDVEVVV